MTLLWRKSFPPFFLPLSASSVVFSPFIWASNKSQIPWAAWDSFFVWGEAEGPRIATVVDVQFRAVRLGANNPPPQNHNLDTMNKQTAQVKSQGFRRRSENKVFLFSFPLEACVERGEICHPTNRRRKGEKDVAQFCTGWMPGFRQPFFCKRRFATHVVHSCLSMNTHRIWTMFLTWVFFRVALLVERRTRNSEVVDWNPGSSSQSPNEARATNRWRGQDSREPRKKKLFYSFGKSLPWKEGSLWECNRRRGFIYGKKEGGCNSRFLPLIAPQTAMDARERHRRSFLRRRGSRHLGWKARVDFMEST